MAYNANIPQPTDQLSQSQGQILDNFTSLGAAWPVNHGAFDGANAGMHMFLQLPTVPNAQVAAVPAMAANQIGMVSQVSAYTAVPELQVIRPGGNNIVEFTSYGNAPSAGFTTGWTRLPSGILLKWGGVVLVSVNVGPAQVTYPVAANIPVFNTVFQTLITPFAFGVQFTLPPYVIGGATYLTTGFEVEVAGNASGGNYRASYLTIGI